MNVGLRRLVELSWIGVIALGAGAASFMSPDPLPTTARDFFFGGSQPGSLQHEIQGAETSCRYCHGSYDEVHEPYHAWASSLMGQAARDPVFHACLTIANQDVTFAGEMCLRCHAPTGWINGRSTPPDGSALAGLDFEGVSCCVCHRMVDPIASPGNPPIDLQVYAATPNMPVNPGNANYIIDPKDRRRGPYVVPPQAEYHQWLQSPFHRKSQMCATCHEVSNPAFTKQPDGTYALNALDTPHPTGNKYEMFPLERTFSEWENSSFAAGPIDMGGRFGGNNPLVSSCQDCHMPKGSATGCLPVLEGPVRPDLGKHEFHGGNTWVLNAVAALYPPEESGLTVDMAHQSIERARAMLVAASDTELAVGFGGLRVRIINQTGHKLPTGYPEGRRMWIWVRFLDAQGAEVASRGAYDYGTATLSTADTKVYEAKLGLDADMAALTGKPQGPSFHFALNNMYTLDNRIPPRGFANATFEAVQAAPIGHVYADGQYWDDTRYTIPPGATRAQVYVCYQTTSKEYIEFLRDENRTNNKGQIAYDQWVLHGKSAPTIMDDVAIDLPACPADLNADGIVDFNDYLEFLNRFNSGDIVVDANGDGIVDFNDYLEFLNLYYQPC